MNSNQAPRHVGIIMDGNGRWAQSRGQIRTQGHLEGLNTAKRMVVAAKELGIQYLTLFTFSTENWKRAADEVDFIMGLVLKYLRANFDFAKENGIRMRYAGDMDGLPADVRRELEDALDATKDFTGMQAALALNYGGRGEIVRAVRRMIAAGKAADPQAVTEQTIRSYLDIPDFPDPDLIIRTAGEFRTSNFLLWEAAYAEYYVSPKYWPDWTKADLEQAVEAYGNRERRFGGVPAQGRAK